MQCLRFVRMLVQDNDFLGAVAFAKVHLHPILETIDSCSRRRAKQFLRSQQAPDGPGTYEDALRNTPSPPPSRSLEAPDRSGLSAIEREDEELAIQSKRARVNIQLKGKSAVKSLPGSLRAWSSSSSLRLHRERSKQAT